MENFRRRQRVDNLMLMGKIGIFAFLLANALGFGYKYFMVGSIERINKVRYHCIIIYIYIYIYTNIYIIHGFTYVFLLIYECRDMVGRET